MEINSKLDGIIEKLRILDEDLENIMLLGSEFQNVEDSLNKFIK